MATLPAVNETLVDNAAASVNGEFLIGVIAPVATNADAIPRLVGSADAVYDQHGYSEAVEYVALHAARNPVLMIGVPIAVPGVIGREDTSGNTGTSVTTVTAGGDGVLAEHDGVLTVITGGTIGTDQIILGLSLDGGHSEKRVRLGTATSYVVPYFNVTLSFAAGTLVAGDTIHTWHGSGPRADSTGWSSAFDGLAAGQNNVRSLLILGDVQMATEVSALRTLIAAYETTFDRIQYVRCGILDRLPLASVSSVSHNMSTTSVTFAEVGATGDTITRASGSWGSDGFATGDLLTISGSASNDGALAAPCTVTSDTVITLDTDDLVDEGPVANVTIVGEPSLTFSDSADTIVRAGGSPGSWLDDGFRVGDSVVVTGTASNDGTYLVTVVTPTTLTFEAGDLADEVIGITVPTIVAGQTKAAYAAATTSEFASIDDEPQIDLSRGKGRTFSPYSLWHLRWPAAWFASLREYQHDLHIPTWRKSDGPVGANLYDTDDQLVEWDDSVDGGAATASRFTSLRTWARGPVGAFIAQSLTRAVDASLLVNTHNVAVVNRARVVAGAAAENAIGTSLILNPDGTATKRSLAKISSEVNAALQQDLLADKLGEGPRVSNVTWVPSTDDVLNIPEPILNSTLTVYIRSAVHTINIATVVR